MPLKCEPKYQYRIDQFFSVLPGTITLIYDYDYWRQILSPQYWHITHWKTQKMTYTGYVTVQQFELMIFLDVFSDAIPQASVYTNSYT